MDSHPSPSGPGYISVAAPISTAWDWTVHVLFQPFDLGKWLTIGFCAWLAWLGRNGGGGAPGLEQRLSEAGSSLEDWVQGHMAVFVVLIACLVIVVVGLTLLFTWLSSRAKLMFLDAVVHNRAAVAEPWRRFREQGNSLFFFRVIVGLAFMVVLGILMGAMVATVLAVGGVGHDLEFAGGLAVVVGFGIILAPLIVLMLLIGVAINDLMVPIQWLRGCRAQPAWTEACRLISRHAGTFVLYALMKFVLALAIGVASCLLTCATCCLAALPYIGVVILLPFYVFGRSYSMHFLAQFGPEYAALGPGGAVPPSPTSPPVPPPVDEGMEGPA